MANLIQRYSRITFFMTLLTLIVVMVGAYTRLSDAGLGCPDWPGCYGSIIVQAGTFEADKAWIEMIHRYIAGTLGLFVFGLTMLAFTCKSSSTTSPSSPRRRGSIFQRLSIMLRNMDPRLRGDDGSASNPLCHIRGLLLFTSVLITFQALLGMWTVTKLLHPTIVMLHLLGGMATLSMVWLAHLRIQNPPAEAAAPFAKGAKIASIVGLIIVVLQIALGGWVSTNYAAFACPDFPTCGAQWWPSLDLNAFNIFIPIDRNFEGGFLDHPARVTIHFIHRLGALITTGYLLIFGLYCLYALPIKKLILGMLFVLFVQVSLGVINIIALVPLWAAVLHNGVAAILLLFMVTITYNLLKARSA